jgi:hypothetical protein
VSVIYHTPNEFGGYRENCGSATDEKKGLAPAERSICNPQIHLWDTESKKEQAL